MSVYYGTSLEAYQEAEARYEEAKEEMRDHREDFVRAYLTAVSGRLDALRGEVEAAISRLGGRMPLDRPGDYAGDAESAVPTLDEMLHGDRVGEFTGRELAKFGIYDADAVSEVASELMGKVFSV